MEVYFDLNKTNGKAYVGWTTKTAQERFEGHCERARNGSPYYFHRAIRKYGPDAFDVITVYKGDDAEEMKQVEKNYIAGMRTNDKRFGYNLTDGGEGSLGYRHTDEAKKKMSSKQLGKIPMLGHHHTAESRTLISQHSAHVGPKDGHGNPHIALYATCESRRKGGLGVALGARRRGGLTAKANGGTNRSLAIARHNRWHVSRNITNPNCPLCQENV
jgi:group I intron endonuclease